jgi:hypothetical protein
MIVRIADPHEDAEGIMLGVRDFVSRMDYTDYLPPVDLFEPFMVQFLSDSSVETVVVEHEGKLVAGMAIAYIPFFLNPQMTQAQELFLWASPDAPKSAVMRVIRFSVKRIHERVKDGGEGIMAHFGKLTSSPDGLGRVYNKLGLREMGTMYGGCF